MRSATPSQLGALGGARQTRALWAGRGLSAAGGRWRWGVCVVWLVGLLVVASSPLRAGAEAPTARRDGARDEAGGAGVVRVVVLADLNERYGDTFYREAVHGALTRTQALAPDLVLIAGDVVAGQRGGLDHRAMWAVFRAQVLEALAPLPVVLTPGNHDASGYRGYEEERALYREALGAYRPPGVRMLDDAGWPLRYSFVLEGVHFVALDATRRDALDAAQLDWLEAELARPEARGARARVVFGHLPLYPVAQGRERDALLGDPDTRARAERVLGEGAATLYISGHHHAYYPGRHPGSGVRQLAVGCLGGGPRVLLGDAREIVDRDDPQERTLSVLEIDEAGGVSLVTYRGPTFDEAARLAPGALPARVGEGPLALERDDALCAPGRGAQAPAPGPADGARGVLDDVRPEE